MPLMCRWANGVFAFITSIASYFHPFAVAESVPRQIYMRAFNWSFLFTLCAAFSYYFFLYDTLFVKTAASMFLSALDPLRDPSERLRGQNVFNINGPFMIAVFSFCLWIFQSKIKSVPPTYRDFGVKTSFSALNLFVFIPVILIVFHIGAYFELNPKITIQNILLLLIFAFAYAFAAFQYTKFLFDFSAFTGWRKTIHSPWRPPLSYDSFNK